MSDSCDPRDCTLARLLCPWGSPGNNTGVGCDFFLQGVFLTQGLNLGLLHCRQFLYRLSYQESSQYWLLYVGLSTHINMFSELVLNAHRLPVLGTGCAGFKTVVSALQILGFRVLFLVTLWWDYNWNGCEMKRSLIYYFFLSTSHLFYFFCADTGRNAQL